MKKMFTVLFFITILLAFAVSSCDTQNAKDDNKSRQLSSLLLATSGIGGIGGGYGCFFQDSCAKSSCTMSHFNSSYTHDECAALAGVYESRPTLDPVCKTPIVGTCSSSTLGVITYYQTASDCPAEKHMSYSQFEDFCKAMGGMPSEH